MASGWELVLLARHGETEWNVLGRREGQLDSPLTLAGAEQAHRNAALVRAIGVDVVFTSPLGRAMATARVFVDVTQAPMVVLDDLAELHHGEFAGMTDDEISTCYPDVWERRSTDKYGWAFPGGESYADADRRARRALASAAAHSARRPLFVSHEMIGRMLQRHLLGVDAQESLTFPHRHDVVYAIDPHARVRRELRLSDG